VLAAIWAVVVVAPMSAATPAGSARTDQAILAGWRASFETIREELVAGKWKAAKRRSDSLLSDMRDRIESGPSSGGLLAMAALYRAIAEAGLGDQREAEWDFHAAVALYPEYSRVDLSPYGEAGRLLDAHRVRETEARVSAEKSAAEPVVEPAGSVKPPERTKAVAPRYPVGKSFACVEGVTVVRAIIDTSGAPICPELVGTPDPVLAFATMDAIRQWRFRPATLDGKPVKVYYNLTMNYKSPRCGKASSRGRMQE
jgi:hypothetical protein